MEPQCQVMLVYSCVTTIQLTLVYNLNTAYFYGPFLTTSSSVLSKEIKTCRELLLQIVFSENLFLCCLDYFFGLLFLKSRTSQGYSHPCRVAIQHWVDSPQNEV